MDIDNVLIDVTDNDDISSKQVVLSVENVSMVFKIANQDVSSLKEHLIKSVSGKISYKKFNALKDISFNVFKGEVVGIIGTNGSGKSTLLKIISGSLNPTEGYVDVDFSKVQYLSLGIGFDSELTARENVYLNGSLIGYSKEFIDSVYDDIVSFAELDGFMEEKVKNFSSGMVSRLGFSIATVGTAPEILILDEVLSVGDEFFRKKSLARIKEIIHSGSTVLLVSHSIGTIRDNCDKVIWIEKGKLKMIGSPDEVCDNYRNIDSELPAKIKLLSAAAVEDSIEVSWCADINSESYIIFRKTDDTQWIKIGISDKLTFIDRKVVSGETYTYTVRGLNSKGMSTAYDKNGVIATCTALPANVRLNRADGFESQIIVSWNTVESAISYNVYRKTEDDTKWYKIAKTSFGRYTDYEVESGKVYYYTVRAENKYGLSRRYDREGVSATVKPFDKEKLKVSIIGSCQSRDIFNSKFIGDYKKRFEILSYFTMSSMLSVMSRPVEYNYENLERAKTNNYQKERFYCELEKNILKTLATKVPDVLILDFYADARYGAVAYDKGYILNRYSRLDGQGVFAADKFGSVYNYSKNTKEFLLLWKEAVDKFMMFMEKYLPDTKIILNTVKGSNKVRDRNGNVYISPKLENLNIKAINNIWSEMDDYLISKYEEKVYPLRYEKEYDLNPDYIFGLGVALVHFHQEYYSYYYDNLLLATADVKYSPHKNSNMNLLKDSDFSNFSDTWTNISGNFELITDKLHKTLRIKSETDNVEKASEYYVWSRPVEVYSSTYTLSFELLIPDDIKVNDDTKVFKIRSFKYFNDFNIKDAIEEIDIKLGDCSKLLNKNNRYTFNFIIKGRYVRVSPVFCSDIPDIEFGNIQLEIGETASDYKPHYDFVKYTICQK